MILPFLIALLAFATLLAVLAPLLGSRRPGPALSSYDQTVYRDQLEELDRDIARDVLTPSEAAAARLEIHRRLLATDRRAHGPSPSVRLSRSPVLAGVLFVAVAAGSVGLYLRLGAPDVPAEPLATASEERQRRSVEQVTEQLAVKLKADPADPQGWLLYARNLAMLNRWEQAEDAYRHAMSQGASGPAVIADHAEMLVLAAGGTVTPAAEAAFQQVLTDDPRSGVARYYLAIAATQAGEPRRAIEMLQALLADMPANSPLRGRIGQRIGEAAQAAHIPLPELAKGIAEPVAGLDADAVAAATTLSNEQRQTMVEGMVARLAAQQQVDPGNLEGWLRLGRAYAVLHEPNKAAEAYEKAAALKPEDASIPLQEARVLLADRQATERLPPRVVELLQRVEAIDPHQPVALWFLGLAAAQDGHPSISRRYWGALLTLLPPVSDDARMIETAIGSLDALGNAENSEKK